MKKILGLLGILVLAFLCSSAFQEHTEANQPFESKDSPISGREILMKKMTPVLSVESIEPCLRFWVDGLDFVKTAEVPDGDKLGFVILTSGNIEIMLQSYASLDKDIPDLGKKMRGMTAVVYIEVNDIHDIEGRLKDYEVVVPQRTTSYGAVEIFYRSPSGHVVGFAEQGPS